MQLPKKLNQSKQQAEAIGFMVKLEKVNSYNWTTDEGGGGYWTSSHWSAILVKDGQDDLIQFAAESAFGLARLINQVVQDAQGQ